MSELVVNLVEHKMYFYFFYIEGKLRRNFDVVETNKETF